MSVKIRLTRVGRKKAPFFRVVVVDSRMKRDGRFLDILGYYHPLNKKDEDKLKVDEEKALSWMHKGARPSETVRSIFSRLGIMKKFHEDRKRLFVKPQAQVQEQQISQ
ncbi:MAG: 30S ribosomal protein S16 [Candidatus Sumerlaeota bacterium]|nr:30S ribosomal protein S16 [Candidatus Sumerlaeota bacterium]